MHTYCYWYLLWGAFGELSILKAGLTTPNLKVTSKYQGETPTLLLARDNVSFAFSVESDGGLHIRKGTEQGSQSVMTVDAEGSVSFQSSSLNVKGDLDVQGQLSIFGVSQWKQVHGENFRGMKAIGWDNENENLVTECAGIPMLGGYGLFSKGEISKEFAGLPSHTFLRVKAVFHFIDAWAGETGFMRLNLGRDGSMVHVWSERHNQNLNVASVSLCGSDVGEGKFAVPIDITVPHEEGSIIIGFGTTVETSKDSNAMFIQTTLWNNPGEFRRSSYMSVSWDPQQPRERSFHPPQGRWKLPNTSPVRIP